MNRILALAPLALLTAIACSSGSIRPGFDDDDDDDDPSEAGIEPPKDGGNGIINSDASADGPRATNAEVFVHSGDTLYKLDPNTNAVTKIGKFSGNDDDMFDIALDADGNMFGTTASGLYRINKENAKCTTVRMGQYGDYPNSLSFVPAGTLEADREVLVGYLDSDYIRIDPDTGAKTTVRKNALGNDLVSSGDIVSIREGDFLTYLTVKPKNKNSCTGECASCKDNDCVFEVDPSTGEKVSNLGSAKRKDVFGLAFWAGDLFGVNTDGKLFRITTNSPPQVTNIPLDGLGSTPIKFYGAGSSTSAPRGPN